LEALEFDVCFKADDDVVFLKSGWDKRYHSAVCESGFHHLVYASRRFWNEVERGHPAHPQLVGRCPVHRLMGCFFTIMPEVIRTVGYMDLKNFGLAVYGHIDFSWRCCRAGFNSEEYPYDLKDSNEFIDMQQDNYRSAIPLGERNRQEKTPAKAEHKRRVMREPDRIHVPYGESEERVRDGGEARKQILISGVGRSGTKFTAALLNDLGLEVGHETVRADGTVSWKHIVAEDVGRFDVILHQVRSPLDTILEKSFELMALHVDIPNEASRLERCMAAWLGWNKLVEKRAQWRFRIEDMDEVFPEILRRVGLRAARSVPDISRSMHSRKQRESYQRVTWKDCATANREPTDRVRATAERYGDAT